MGCVFTVRNNVLKRSRGIQHKVDIGSTATLFYKKAEETDLSRELIELDRKAMEWMRD